MTSTALLHKVLWPAVMGVFLLLAWDRAIVVTENTLLPRPLEVVAGIGELAREGLLHRYILASLVRVRWGFFLAAVVGIPLGLLMGWFAVPEMADHWRDQALLYAQRSANHISVCKSVVGTAITSMPCICNGNTAALLPTWPQATCD